MSGTSHRRSNDDDALEPPVRAGYLLDERLPADEARRIETHLADALASRRRSVDPVRVAVGAATLLVIALAVVALFRQLRVEEVKAPAASDARFPLTPRAGTTRSLTLPPPPVNEPAPPDAAPRPAVPLPSTQDLPASERSVSPTGAASARQAQASPASRTPPESLVPGVVVAEARPPEAAREMALRVARTDIPGKDPIVIVITYRRAGSGASKEVSR
jgi:hypothetical protein